MEYQIEWQVNRWTMEKSQEELVAEIKESINGELEEPVDDEIGEGEVVIRKNHDPSLFVSIASLGVAGISTLVQIYQFLQERDDSQVGIMSDGDGNMIYADEISQTQIEEVNGTYIGNVEGDLNLFQVTPHQAEELMEEIEKRSSRRVVTSTETENNRCR